MPRTRAPALGESGRAAPITYRSRGIGELTGDFIELARQLSDPLIVVVVEALPGLDTEPIVGDVLFDGGRRGSIGGEFRIERVGDVTQRVVADEVGHLERSEHRDKGTQ